MQEVIAVRRETHVPAPPAAVFALLTDPEKILRWMGTEAQIEPQPGGIYLVNVTGARFARRSDHLKLGQVQDASRSSSLLHCPREARPFILARRANAR